VSDYQQPPLSYPETILRALQQIALSPAMATEIETYKSWRGQSYPLTVTDAQGATVNLGIEPLAMQLQNAGSLRVIAPKFGTVTTTELDKAQPPFPVLVLSAKPGKVITHIDQVGWPDLVSLPIQARVYAATSDHPQVSQDEAMALCVCLHTLYMRNQQLGGLVRTLYGALPVQPLGPGQYMGTTCAAAQFSFEAIALF
jgi:hypothetical protein